MQNRMILREYESILCIQDLPAIRFNSSQIPCDFLAAMGNGILRESARKFERTRYGLQSNLILNKSRNII